ncbi:MAG: Asp-tRNA(Asn)/Glu-tRNA(Gln) amidotransferase subunit GatA [Actinobacteria bacterium]|nr:Asp-tRNA(Asn)/Glu-tRNA(Gln) amidotransferase subunit GatA [Actinomycetota bacterium]
MTLYNQTIAELHKKLVAREVSSEEITRDVLERVKDVEQELKAYLTLTEEAALAAARTVDAKIAAGEKIGPLAGIPVAVKDVMSTKGVRTTCASKILENYVPVYTATAVKKLLGDGAVMIGKTNMDEFAMGSSTENSGFNPTMNPWDIERVPGGSSGGSAAAVAAGEAIYALGSDTGGSIRQPAALCGVVGMKPTYGLVSRYGLVAFASSLDQIGPFTKDVTDCAIVLKALVGHDPADSTSLEYEAEEYVEALQRDVKGMRFGVPKEFMEEGVEPGVKQRFEEAIELFAKLGVEVDETTLPHVDYALSAYYIIAPAEASSNLARFDGVRYGLRVEGEDMIDTYMKTRAAGFGDEVKRRIMLGTYALSAGYYEAYYGQAQKVRTLVAQDFEEAFKKFDGIISPTSPTVAFKIGEKVADPLAMYLSDIFTIPVNLGGFPGISVPCGLSDGLPVGLQIIGPTFGEGIILNAAYAFEQALGFKERPSL